MIHQLSCLSFITRNINNVLHSQFVQKILFVSSILSFGTVDTQSQKKNQVMCEKTYACVICNCLSSFPEGDVKRINIADLPVPV